MANSVNYVFLLSLTIIIIGILLKRWNIITNEDGKFMARLIFNLTLPAVILNTVPYVILDMSLALMPAISFGYSIIIIIIGLFIFKNHPRNEKGIILMTIIGFNVGNFAYPLVEGIWGIEGLQYIAMFDVGNAITIFVLMYIISAIYSPKIKNENENASNIKINPKDILHKVSRSAPLICYIISLILNIAGWTLPIFTQDIITIIARANMVIVLLTLGVFLDLKFEKSQWRTIFKVLSVRYIFGILIGVLIYWLLPFENQVKLIILVGLVLPIGMASIAFAVEFGHDEKIVGTLNNLTIIISFGLMWLIILLLG